MSNCGKWLNKNEFTLCWINAMAKHHNKSLFNESSNGDRNRHWMYDLINECYDEYVNDMKDGSEDWGVYITIGNKKYFMYITCDDHKGEYSYFKRVKGRF